MRTVAAPRLPWASSLERLLSRTVEMPGGCRIWQGAKPRGYGLVKFRGRSTLAHRVAFELANGPIPPGMCVMHLCDMPPCLNPAHLALGTQVENIRDRDRKGRHGRGRRRMSLSWTETHATPVESAPDEQSPLGPTLLERFWARVDRSGECWEWRGQRQRQGYGQLGWAGKRYAAHRFAWAITNGPIPDGLVVCHRCDNPGCVRPEHLFLGTHRDNARDRVAKGRGSRGEDHWTRKHPERMRPLSGEQNPAARLRLEQVLEIRRRYAEGGVSMKRLAAEFGVNVTNIFYIVHRKTWATPEGDRT